MKAFHDCLPCLLRQTLEAARLAEATPELEEKIVRDSMAVLSDYKSYENVPAMCKILHGVIKEYTGVADPYSAIKLRDIEEAKSAYPFLKEYLQTKQGDLYWTIKIAAMGNVLDAGIYKFVDLKKVIQKELDKEFSICDMEIFAEKLSRATTLLIIADNAGETVFDRVLAEQLPHIEIIYAVRDKPILNDATLEDARLSGLDTCTRIISSGCSAPGTLLSECSQEFIDVLSNADIVIAKGQGNYESLCDEGLPIFFLLKAKCNVVAQKLGVKLNDYVFKFGGKE